MSLPSPRLGRLGALAALVLLCSCAGSARVGGGSVKAGAPTQAKAQGKSGASSQAAAPEVDPVTLLAKARATLASHPKDTQALFDVGFAWQRRADGEKDETARHSYLDSAKVAYDAVLAVDSTNVKALVHSGLVLEDQANADEALKRYQRATEVAPTDPRPYVNLGSLLYFHFKRIYDAKTALTKALELDPSNADAHFNLGVMFADATMFREARTEWERVAATGDGPAKALAEQNLDKIRPLLASQDSAEAAAKAAPPAAATSPAGSLAPVAPQAPPPAPAPSAPKTAPSASH